MEVYSLGCDSWEVIIGFNNGLVPNRQQAIIWTTDEQHLHAAVG